MSLETIDTFEHDIAEEIKNKEATIGDIASAGGTVENKAVEARRSSFVTVILILCILVVTGGILYFGYAYYNNKVNPIPNTSPIVIPEKSDTSLLQTLSPLFPEALGRFVKNVEKNDLGYTIMISSSNAYSSVFAYMIKNEILFSDSIARAVGSVRDMSTTTPPFTFSDFTTNNQNMRVGTSASSTVVYAFINTQALIIASSTDAILKLRSAILR